MKTQICTVGNSGASACFFISAAMCMGPPVDGAQPE
jgi:hypothetical protein